MSPTPTIPKGWHKVRSGGIIRRFDRFWLTSIREWVPTMGPGQRVDGLLLYIRKTKAPTEGRKKAK